MPEKTPEVKDGFDLIEYPCEFSFKAMCRSSSGDSNELVKALVSQHVEATQIKDVQSISSRTGKFNSVTIKVQVSDRETLEIIYHALAASEHVVMTL